MGQNQAKRVHESKNGVSRERENRYLFGKMGKGGYGFWTSV